MNSVYIAGRSGASGLTLESLLQQRGDIHLLPSPGRAGPDALDRETELLNSADIVILCLPPGVVNATVGRIVSQRVKIIDNSSANRVSNEWVYGLPELGPQQREAIRGANRVSSPGCFATGFILALRPLVDRDIVDPTAPVCAQGIGGYSAGGKRMIEWFEQPGGRPAPPFIQVHALDLDYPQVPEMQRYTGWGRPPIFIPMVGHFRRGMLVSIPLHRDWLRSTASLKSMRNALREQYAGEPLVSVRTCPPLESWIALPQDISTGVELYVEGNNEHVLLVARLDNLGKGGAIASIQNMNLLLGCNEFVGIV